MKHLIALLLCLSTSAQAAITHVGASQAATGTATASVTRAAGSTGNIYTVMCGCNLTTASLTVTNTTTAFTWTRIFGPVKNGTTDQLDSFRAKPSTTASQTITCNCAGGSFTNIGLDEWSGTDTTSVIDVSSGTTNTVTNCNTTTNMTVNNDAVWGASEDSITAVGNINGSIATAGANDGGGDWTEFRILSGSGSGSTATSAYTGTAGGAICIVAAILPAAGGAAVTGFNKASRLQRYE